MIKLEQSKALQRTIRKDDPADLGYSTQACNVNSRLGQFSELEYHIPAIGGRTGRLHCDDAAQVWAFRKPSLVNLRQPGPASVVPAAGGELVKLDAQLRDIALTCGRACGLELWGVDVAMTAAGPWIIEVNDFPTYSEVPGAGAAIAHHVLSLVQIRALEKAMGRDRLSSVVRKTT